MTLPARKLPEEPKRPIALHDRAMENLRFIREAMERSGSFTHVSGMGGVAMGCVALAAALLARSAETTTAWISIWMAAAVVSLGLAGAFMARKSREEGMALLSGPGRKFAKSVTPALAAGGVLTVVLADPATAHLLPGVWLLLYGTAVVTGGAHSVRPVPLMGLAFMVAGALAFLAPPTWGNAFMAGGFGGLHIIFGSVIWRKYGG